MQLLLSDRASIATAPGRAGLAACIRIRAAVFTPAVEGRALVRIERHRLNTAAVAETVIFKQRIGIDIVPVVVTAIAMIVNIPKSSAAAAAARALDQAVADKTFDKCL